MKLKRTWVSSWFRNKAKEIKMKTYEVALCINLQIENETQGIVLFQ